MTEPITQTEIDALRAMGRGDSYIVGPLFSLQRRGLIELLPNPDGGPYIHKITEDGQAVLDDDGIERQLSVANSETDLTAMGREQLLDHIAELEKERDFFDTERQKVVEDLSKWESASHPWHDPDHETGYVTPEAVRQLTDAVIVERDGAIEELEKLQRLARKAHHALHDILTMYPGQWHVTTSGKDAETGTIAEEKAMRERAKRVGEAIHSPSCSCIGCDPEGNRSFEFEMHDAGWKGVLLKGQDDGTNGPFWIWGEGLGEQRMRNDIAIKAKDEGFHPLKDGRFEIEDDGALYTMTAEQVSVWCTEDEPSD